jgi:hypothetical protein
VIYIEFEKKNANLNRLESTSPIGTFLDFIFGLDAVLISASFFAGLAIGVVFRRYKKTPLTQAADQIV